MANEITIGEMMNLTPSKYTEEMWQLIERIHQQGQTLKSIAQELGIPKSTLTMAHYRWVTKPKKPKEKVKRYKWTFNIDFNKERQWVEWIKDYEEYNNNLQKSLRNLFRRKRYIATFDTHKKKGTLDIMVLNGYDYEEEIEQVPNIIVDTANELGIGVVLK